MPTKKQTAPGDDDKLPELTPEQFQELAKKMGFEVRMRGALPGKGTAPDIVFTMDGNAERGYDRDYDKGPAGYDRVFDRTNP